MELLTITSIYFSVAVFTLMLNAMIAGYNGTQINKDDVIQSIIWPISLATLFGLLARIGIESYREEVNKPKKKETK